VDDCHQKRPGTAGDKKYSGAKKNIQPKKKKKLCEKPQAFMI
jgi:hypothetical protein